MATGVSVIQILFAKINLRRVFFLPLARRPAVTGGGGASKMAAVAAISGVSEQKIQDFQPSLT